MFTIMGWNTCLDVYEGTGSFVLKCSRTYTLLLAMKIAKPPYYLIFYQTYYYKYKDMYQNK